jgi:prevent-host-death family protein
MKLGLREANQHFSRAIKAVRAGKDVILTDRGQPIAVIKPLEADHQSKVALRRMADEGLVRLPVRKGPLPRFAPVPISGDPLSQTIIDDRDDRV